MTNDGPKAGPGVSQRLMHVYDQYLAGIEDSYSDFLNHKKLQALQLLRQQHGTPQGTSLQSSQPQQQGSSPQPQHTPAQLAASNLQSVPIYQILKQHAFESTEHMRAQRLDEGLIQLVLKHRQQLQSNAPIDGLGIMSAGQGTGNVPTGSPRPTSQLQGTSQPNQQQHPNLAHQTPTLGANMPQSTGFQGHPGPNMGPSGGQVARMVMSGNPPISPQQPQQLAARQLDAVKASVIKSIRVSLLLLKILRSSLTCNFSRRAEPKTSRHPERAASFVSGSV